MGTDSGDIDAQPSLERTWLPGSPHARVYADPWPPGYLGRPGVRL